MNVIFNPFTAATSGIQIASSLIQARQAKKEMERQQRLEKKARQKLNQQKNIYRNLDTSNPYLNMENTMEDLTINQKQAEFERQTFQQSQANIMQGLQGAAGGSGIAALAQSLAQQGQLASQRAAASIGQQEARNQMARQQQAGRIQEMQRQGERESQQLELQKQGTLMNLESQDVMSRREMAAQAQQQRMSALGGISEGLTGLTTSFSPTYDKKGELTGNYQKINLF